MTSGSALRLARAAVFAAVCVVTAALGHVLMSRAALPWWTVGCAFAGTTAVAWWLTGRERGAPLVTGATVAAQLGLHELFGLAQRLSAPAAVPSPRHMGTGHMHSMDEPSAAMGSAGSSVSLESAGTELGDYGSFSMFAAHVLAALLCGVWLWRGEVAAHRAGRSLAALVFPPLRLVFLRPVPVRPAPPVRAELLVPVRRLLGVLLQYAVARRGPPTGFVHC
ncbi:hypothetical protein ACFS5L_06870 [Streptomyces phyllanthi]|uniref:PE-PGRS family protein n=1 Tax=Streptomyces phyllanthi TaxID=1803180 RepID=A0A5N8W277_9ACTN|nr:hypothetical protein [Streptomyces phyllanthi]MPY41593.1 hypothetical protein [Streptomyces phyllanthi]